MAPGVLYFRSDEVARNRGALKALARGTSGAPLLHCSSGDFLDQGSFATRPATSAHARTSFSVTSTPACRSREATESSFNRERSYSTRMTFSDSLNQSLRIPYTSRTESSARDSAAPTFLPYLNATSIAV